MLDASSSVKVIVLGILIELALIVTLSPLASPNVTLPSTVKLLLMLVVPVAEPISIAVAAPAKFTVVATVFHKFCVV